MAKKKSGD